MMKLLRVSALMLLLPLGFAGSVLAQEPAYPIVIDHALGRTVIDKKPERVATVAWANHEVPLALGIVPVGMAAANFGDDDGDGLNADIGPCDTEDVSEQERRQIDRKRA